MADMPLPADHPFVRDLAAGPANHVPLSPVASLERSAAVWPERVAIRHGRVACTYAEFERRARRLASALARRGSDHRRVLAHFYPGARIERISSRTAFAAGAVSAHAARAIADVGASQ